MVIIYFNHIAEQKELEDQQELDWSNNEIS
jgi:hypothetical protein